MSDEGPKTDVTDSGTTDAAQATDTEPAPARARHYCRYQDYPGLEHGGSGTTIPAIEEVVEDPQGRFHAGNGEYGSQVNYCPYCGMAAKLVARTDPAFRMALYLNLTSRGDYGEAAQQTIASDPIGAAIRLLGDPLLLLLGTQLADRVRAIVQLESRPDALARTPRDLLVDLIEGHARRYGGWDEIEDQGRPAPEGVHPVLAKRFGRYLDVVARPIGADGIQHATMRTFQPDTSARDESGSQRRYILEYSLGRRVIVDPMPTDPPLVAYELVGYRIGRQFDWDVATPRCARCAEPTEKGEDVVLACLIESWTPPDPADGVYGVVQLDLGKHGIVHTRCATAVERQIRGEEGT